MSEEQAQVAPETAAPVMPAFKAEYCWMGDWEGFRVRSLKPVPNFIVRFFCRTLLGVHFRKFEG